MLTFTVLIERKDAPKLFIDGFFGQFIDALAYSLFRVVACLKLQALFQKLIEVSPKVVTYSKAASSCGLTCILIALWSTFRHDTLLIKWQLIWLPGFAIKKPYSFLDRFQTSVHAWRIRIWSILRHHVIFFTFLSNLDPSSLAKIARRLVRTLHYRLLQIHCLTFLSFASSQRAIEDYPSDGQSKIGR